MRYETELRTVLTTHSQNPPVELENDSNFHKAAYQLMANWAISDVFRHFCVSSKAIKIFN